MGFFSMFTILLLLSIVVLIIGQHSSFAKKQQQQQQQASPSTFKNQHKKNNNKKNNPGNNQLNKPLKKNNDNHHHEHDQLHSPPSSHNMRKEGKGAVSHEKNENKNNKRRPGRSFLSRFSKQGKELMPVVSHPAQQQQLQQLQGRGGVEDGSSPTWAYTVSYFGTTCEAENAAVADAVIVNQCFETSYDDDDEVLSVIFTCYDGKVFDTIYGSPNCDPETQIKVLQQPYGICSNDTNDYYDTYVGIYASETFCEQSDDYPLPGNATWVLSLQYIDVNCSTGLWGYSGVLNGTCYNSEYYYDDDYIDASSDTAGSSNEDKTTKNKNEVIADTNGDNLGEYIVYSSSQWDYPIYTYYETGNCSTDAAYPEDLAGCYSEFFPDDDYYTPYYYYENSAYDNDYWTRETDDYEDYLPRTYSSENIMYTAGTPVTVATAVPTIAKTYAPTKAPTAYPTYPDELHSLFPTLATAPPTVAPTVLVSTLVFISNISLIGVTTINLDSSSQYAILNASATSMEIPISEVAYLSAYYAPSSVSTLRHDRRNLQSSPIIVVTKVTAPVTGSTDGTGLYLQLTTALNESVNSGLYTNILQSVSGIVNATQTMNAQATGVSSSDATIIPNPSPTSDSSDNDELSGGAIAGIALGLLAAIMICAGSTYCYFIRVDKAQQAPEKERKFFWLSSAHPLVQPVVATAAPVDDRLMTKNALYDNNHQTTLIEDNAGTYVPPSIPSSISPSAPPLSIKEVNQSL